MCTQYCFYALSSFCFAPGAFLEYLGKMSKNPPLGPFFLALTLFPWVLYSQHLDPENSGQLQEDKAPYSETTSRDPRVLNRRIGFESDFLVAPKSVRDASQYVLQVFVLNSPENYLVGIDSAGETMKFFEDSLSKNGSPGLHYVAKLLKGCIEENNFPCVLPDIQSAGSAFLVEDGRSIMSALHVFSHKSEPPKDTPPFLLLNSAGEVVVDSRTEKPSKIQAIDGEMADSKKFEDFQTPDSRDFIKFSFSRKLGNSGIFLAEDTKLIQGGQIYLLGYPTQTHDRKKFGANDAQGNRLEYTVGKTMNFDKYLGIYFEETPPDFIVQKFREIFLPLTNDNVHGMSGGPILNEKGQLIGIYSEQMEGPDGGDPEETDQTKLSYGAVGMHLQQIKKFLRATSE